MTNDLSPQVLSPTDESRTAPDKGRRVGQWLRLLVGATLLFFVLRSIDRTALVATLSSIEPGWLVLLAVMSVFDRLLMALKFNVLLRARGVRIPAWRAIRLCYVGNLLGTVTPGGLGGEVYRVAALRSRKGDGSESSPGRTEIVVASILLERTIGLAVIGVMAAAFFPLSARYLGAEAKGVIWALLLGSAALVGGLAAALRTEWMQRIARRLPHIKQTRVGARLGQVYASFAAYRRHPDAIVRFVALTALEVLVLISLDYLAARSLRIDPPLAFFLGTMPLLHILIRLPATFEGLGVQEGLFAFFLLQAGFAAEDGVAVSLVLRAVFVVLVLIPAIAMVSWAGADGLRD